ncbi:hypothetical protein [Actinophytocola xanthii]|uniref:Uncharacterized protein n=1 Tax=Actinophytocola xanthii TaxID=1912961 RepID=A0A1Q8CP61_9PSEU|nr:hypothetical protein [Actinophytocola xanthii]OLF16154.1 hypothetical protein BU204_18580 [Actinophytocola xanthii]
MYVTPEVVKAEMDYRMEQASGGIALEYRREARALRASWWQRVFGHHTEEPPAANNEARLAA